MSATNAPLPHGFEQELLQALRSGQLSRGAGDVKKFASDQGPVTDYREPAAVVWAESVADVQAILRLASRYRVPVVARGAGTGVSGGAHATAGCLVLCLDRMDNILELNPEDEVARVEPGVINADLNAAAAAHGLMYAPDPASYRISTIGGNVATNAGGLRCAKYGVTRDAVLALDVVLADGTLIHTGHRTFKGVAGYDLTGLMVGSEGTLGIVVGATVRLKYLPTDIRTLAVFFPDMRSATAGVLALGKARVQPSILELMDGSSLDELDRRQGSNLAGRGSALLLAQFDGLAAAQEAEIASAALAALGGNATLEEPGEAERLVDLRRHNRGMDADSETTVGEDVAVPRSQLVHYVDALAEMAGRHGVGVRIIAHAGDGNLHPTFWVGDADAAKVVALNAALDESIDKALALGGTITGEHGVGQYKLRWLPLEQAGEVRALQRRIKELFDPLGILNPGKAIADD
ncbi:MULTISPECIES: FAD-binding oxidoreductase [unclassified Arthrobacter]|uniref:FAD-binding oxidoreductase n=1 Tax=unclassified Arthrobacter TaxID=235627 RepID=UPI00159E77A1|nr:MULTISPECIES: FAD-linked oxidase C-terminal domain-containing protein [unclassified Arthrobacter]MCQ9166090.1 FAD-binding protein [Arthrobacter sp. STN4]NVN00650.1 FAD-binding protein [Arthrobacter sp. SDTb3-6]